jgi:hypothetical protein
MVEGEDDKFSVYKTDWFRLGLFDMVWNVFDDSCLVSNFNVWFKLGIIVINWFLLSKSVWTSENRIKLIARKWNA